jgi:L-threonate 2-dehydrogenase
MKIAFVGLGAMGRPMAENLVKAGFDVTGFDVFAVSMQAYGGKTAPTLQAACQGANALLLMVVNSSQAEEVLFTNHALDYLAPNALVILCATCAPQAVEHIAQQVEAKQHIFIDCPVSGGIVGAKAASLTLMVAASDVNYAKAKPLLNAIGSKLFHVGQKAGQGAMVKVINQLLCGVHIAAAAEALALGEKAGLNGATLLEIFGGSAASSWMLKDRGPRMLESEPQVTSAVDIFVKDMTLVSQTSQDTKANTPLAALTLELFKQTSHEGFGRQDDSQIIQILRNTK